LTCLRDRGDEQLLNILCIGKMKRLLLSSSSSSPSSSAAAASSSAAAASSPYNCGAVDDGDDDDGDDDDGDGDDDAAADDDDGDDEDDDDDDDDEDDEDDDDDDDGCCLLCRCLFVIKMKSSSNRCFLRLQNKASLKLGARSASKPMGISVILVALYLQPRVKSRKRRRAGHQHYTTQNIGAAAVPVAEVTRSKFQLLRIAGNGGSLRNNRRNKGHLRRG
jgi:hypothetical protein